MVQDEEEKCSEKIGGILKGYGNQVVYMHALVRVESVTAVWYDTRLPGKRSVRTVDLKAIRRALAVL